MKGSWPCARRSARARGALRRTLLAESLVLCGSGAVLGVLLARPLVAVVGRYAARFSVRALDVTVDASLLWVGAGLAMAAAVRPRLYSAPARRRTRPTGLGLASGGVRITPGTNRRLRVFAVAQIALSFVLLAGAGMLVSTLLVAAGRENRLQPAPGARVRRADCRSRHRASKSIAFFEEAMRRIEQAARRAARRGRELRAVARRRHARARVPVCRRGLHARGRRREPATAGCASWRPASSRRSACRSSPAATSTTTTAAAPSSS